MHLELALWAMGVYLEHGGLHVGILKLCCKSVTV